MPLDPKSTVVQTFQKRFPGLAGPGVIPKAVYGTRADTPTLTFWNLFVCPQSLPEEAAYVLTKATFENLATLRQAVVSGILDAPQLKNNPFGRGAVRTRILGGRCLAVAEDGSPILETQRLQAFL